MNLKTSIIQLKSKTLIVLSAVLAIMCSIALSSCSDKKSYAELLTEENHSVNLFLVDQRVCDDIPTDTNFVFETGPDAPYYKLDEDGNMYMQVVNPGTKGNYADEDEIIYFRYTRYSLYNYNGTLPTGEGNETDMNAYNAWFRFQNFQLQSSYQWGAGIQQPLLYLPVDCEVNIVIKSQYGFYSETSYVNPYLYRLRYYRQRT